MRVSAIFMVSGFGLTLACGGSDGGVSSVKPSTGGSGAKAGKDGGLSSGGAWAKGGSGGSDAGGVTSGGGSGGGSAGSPQCSPATTPCADKSECCGDLACDTTSLGQVCCGNEGASCTTANGEDCCGELLCIDGKCGYGLDPGTCSSPCKPAPALNLEKQRLDAIGGSFLGICGDANHTYGYHVPAALLPSSDYSLQGALNVPVCDWYACAIDIGMNWPASRDWLKWLIANIASDNIKNIAEVIGSYDGVDVRYWSDSSGWSTNGIPYTGSGHDTWTHVSIYRSTALDDHHILSGWTANGPTP